MTNVNLQALFSIVSPEFPCPEFPRYLVLCPRNSADDNAPFAIDDVNLEDMFGEIEPDGGDSRQIG